MDALYEIWLQLVLGFLRKKYLNILIAVKYDQP